MEKTGKSLMFSTAHQGKYGQEVRLETKKSKTRKKSSNGGKPNPKKKRLRTLKKAKTMSEKSQQSTVTKGYADSSEVKKTTAVTFEYTEHTSTKMKKKKNVEKTSQLPAKKQRYPTILERERDVGDSEMQQQPTGDKPTAVKSEVKTKKVARKPKISIAEEQPSTAKKRKADTSEVKITAATSSGMHTEHTATKKKKKMNKNASEIKTPVEKTFEMHTEAITIKKKRKKQKFEGTLLQPGRVLRPKIGTASFVTFHMETTGLICEGSVPHITQIGAYDLISGATFSKYVKPKKPISTEAQHLTRIVMDNSSGMRVRGRSVRASDIREAFDSFLKWIRRFPNVVLISNYGKGFDFPILREAVKNIGRTEEFSDSVCGFIDSLLIFRKQYPGQNSYKQRELVKEILKISYTTYNAKSSAKVLGKLIKHTELSPRELHAYIRNTC